MTSALLARAGRGAGVAVAGLALIAAVAASGCGGDEETTTPSTTETIEPATPTGPTGAAGQQGTGGQKAPSDDSNVDPEDGTVTPPPESDTQGDSGGTEPEDSAENDIPPDSDAEEAFEKYCDENPGACG